MVPAATRINMTETGTGWHVDYGNPADVAAMRTPIRRSVPINALNWSNRHAISLTIWTVCRQMAPDPYRLRCLPCPADRSAAGDAASCNRPCRYRRTASERTSTESLPETDRTPRRFHRRRRHFRLGYSTDRRPDSQGGSCVCSASSTSSPVTVFRRTRRRRLRFSFTAGSNFGTGSDILAEESDVDGAAAATTGSGASSAEAMSSRRYRR